MSFALSAQTINLNTTYTSSTSITPLGSINSISSLNITGSATLLNDTGIVRLILVDNNLNEYLLYEGHVFTMTGSTMNFSAYTDETQYLNNIKPSSILIIAKNATVTLNSIQYVTTVTTNSLLQTQTLASAFYKTKIDARIATMNLRLAQLGYTWTATSTSSSYMSYSNKRNLYGLESDDYNNYSEEHYASGPLDFPPLSQPLLSFPSTSSLKSNTAFSFDWRFRHGATNKDSPYYNEHEGCSGWINQMRDQQFEEWKCGTCVFFGTIAMVENVLNLYYNRHIDYDLSEKATAVCNFRQKPVCNGKGFLFPIESITKDGLMKESCYPYIQPMQEPCTAKDLAYSNCTDKEIVRVNSNFITVPKPILSKDDADVAYCMRKLVKYGPFYSGKEEHAYCVVGWDIDIDNNLHWYYKNSNFDQNKTVHDGIDVAAKDELVTIGYLGEKTSNYDLINTIPDCVDLDRDGYYTWTDITTCPSGAYTAFKDLDDHNNQIWCSGATKALDIPVTKVLEKKEQIWQYYRNIAGDVEVYDDNFIISSQVVMQPSSKFIIKSGATVTIDGINNTDNSGILNNASIIVEPGGKLYLKRTEYGTLIKLNPQYASYTDYNIIPPVPFSTLFSSNYTESDRVCVDMDGDGYYNWGVGEKPATCPPCSPAIEDGDDWNKTIGEIDEYGQPKTFVPLPIAPYTVSSSATWSGVNVICGDLIIKNNSTLTLTSTGSIKMQAGRTLTIEGNSSLIILGGKVSMGSIVVNSGGTLTLDNDGIIELCNKVSSLTVNGVFNQNKGSVNIVNPFDPK